MPDIIIYFYEVLIIEVVPYPNNGQTPSLCPSNPSAISLSSAIIPQNGTGSVPFNDSIGYYHNAILHEMNHSLNHDNISTNNIYRNVADYVSMRFNIPTEITYGINRELSLNQSINENILAKFQEYDSVQTIIARWKDYCPEISNQLEVLESFLNGIINISPENNDGTYLNEALRIISNSGLSYNKSIELRNALIVANASYQLWAVVD